MNLASDASVILLRELSALRREIELFPDNESVWRTLPGVTNSAGNLALHIAGNLRYFVGSVLGGISYVRDREMEFGRRSGTRGELVTEIDAAAAAVEQGLTGVSTDVLDREFPEAVGGHRMTAGLFLLHLCSHTGYHLGQVGYLRRAVTGQTQASGALPLGPLAST
jgi:hypothetical protein